ncbi:MAG: hypothetical protein H6686_02590 [Fibrobacteria bacterium]|nr:hypothetical protein [Fibrobacteria bacterium]
MRRFLLTCLMAVSFAGAKGVSLTGYAGGSSPWGDMDPSTAWSVHALWRIDQMVAAGVGAGYLTLPGTDVAETTARLQVRLPAGKQLMPFLEGESGVGIRPVLVQSIFVWRFGGGMDLKLGDRSSLLVGGGAMTRGRAYGRVGLLLEL